MGEDRQVCVHSRKQHQQDSQSHQNVDFHLHSQFESVPKINGEQDVVDMRMLGSYSPVDQDQVQSYQSTTLPLLTLTTWRPSHDLLSA